jgi:hypothetical protein
MWAIRRSCRSDLLIIQLNPASRKDRPRNAADIAGRLNEITFNASLLHELENLALLKSALSEEPTDHRLRQDVFNRVRDLNIHRIAADEAPYGRGPRSKRDPEETFRTRRSAKEPRGKSCDHTRSTRWVMGMRSRPHRTV